MQPYKNLSGNSGVVAFELHASSVTLQFQDGGKYEYTAKKPGAAAVAQIKRLATAGRGLSTFISQEVKSAYARKVL